MRLSVAAMCSSDHLAAMLRMTANASSGVRQPCSPERGLVIRVRLHLQHRARDLALFNLGIDSKLRACDLVRLRVRDVYHGSTVASRAIVMQQKTARPVQFEITAPTRNAVAAWIERAGLRSEDYLFPSRVHASPHIGTRQYAGILASWVREIGLDPIAYGTHSMRRTKASLIYRRTNLRAVPNAPDADHVTSRQRLHVARDES